MDNLFHIHTLKVEKFGEKDWSISQFCLFVMEAYVTLYFYWNLLDKHTTKKPPSKMMKNIRRFYKMMKNVQQARTANVIYLRHPDIGFVFRSCIDRPHNPIVDNSHAINNNVISKTNRTGSTNIVKMHIYKLTGNKQNYEIRIFI